MDDKQENSPEHVCPSCGKIAPATRWPSNLWGANWIEKIQFLAVLFLIGYALFSTIFIILSVPPDMRHYKYGYNARPEPFASDPILMPLSREPLVQVIVGFGYILPVLCFSFGYWWGVIRRWRQRRSGVPPIKPVKKYKPIYKYKCSDCGSEWEEEEKD